MSYKYFKLDEFKCSETGENHIDPSFVFRLDMLREKCGFSFHINSGYRSPRHSIEAAKDKPGMHTTGKAADIRVENGIQRRRIVEEAMKMNFHGIGVAKGYVHVDDRDMPAVLWEYG